ncbi:MAG TPA: sulfite exporter TauE/SafE family protein [Burkholderiaceae bacterium]|nr:sulfite exporter TauE/SafE family protein [Burkholderiaceae bacterium]
MLESLLLQTDLSLVQFAGVAAIIIWAYTIFGLTGFGSSIMAIPLLTQIVPLRTAVPMILLFDIILGTMLGLRNRHNVHTGELKRIVPSVIAGMILGLLLLVYAPERPLLFVLGLFVLLHSGWSLLFKRGFSELNPRLSTPFGLAGGMLTSMFGTGGPVYAIYLAGRLRDPAQLRATTSILVVITAFTRLILFALAGLYVNTAIFVLAAMLVPFAFIGYLIGVWLHKRIAPAKVVRVVWAVLIVAGVGLLVRSVLG